MVNSENTNVFAGSGGVDERLLAWASQLQQEKQAKRKENEEFHAFDRLSGATIEISKNRSKGEAIKQGILLGSEIRQEISDGRFDGGTFYAVLFLCVIKDSIDLVTLGTIGVIVNIFITITLFIVFFLKKSFLKKYLIKRYIWPMIIEFIPIVCAFPSYTVSCILLKMKLDNRTRNLEEELRKVNKKITQIKRVNYILK